MSNVHDTKIYCPANLQYFFENKENGSIFYCDNKCKSYSYGMQTILFLCICNIILIYNSFFCNHSGRTKEVILQKINTMNKGKDKVTIKQKGEEKMLDRDVSWMFFNHRILQEARKEDIPLLERLSFLGIYSNNLDEFFRVRMASLNRLLESDNKEIHRQRATIKANIERINRLNAIYSQE